MKYSIKDINYRYILNSYLEQITEYIVRLKNGAVGFASPPKGETVSIYEDYGKGSNSNKIIKRIKSHFSNEKISQQEFDEYLLINRLVFKQSNIYALSLAFFNAICASLNMPSWLVLRKIYGSDKSVKVFKPIVLCNVMNGGFHAYTNPVLSDFSEYLLVPRFNDYLKLAKSIKFIYEVIKQKIKKLPRTIVNNNPVYFFKKRNNESCIKFLLNLLKDINLDKDFDLMIDVCASEFFKDNHYELSITKEGKFSPNEFKKYWTYLLNKYPIKILEDPFCEKDYKSWKDLTQGFPQKLIAGDNLFSGEVERLKYGFKEKLSSAVLIKPDQACTVTKTIEFIRFSQKNKIPIISSHRSIETESTFLSDLTIAFDIPMIKIGPFSGFPPIMKLNALIRTC